MVRQVFFSFHYGRDIWRVNQVRNSWVAKKDREAAGFVDAAEWEEVKREGEDAIQEWIDDQIHGTSVTVVLIGNETADRDWIRYEIKKSFKRGNGIVGIKVHSLKDKEGSTDFSGSNPLKKFVVEQDGDVQTLSSIFPPTTGTGTTGEKTSVTGLRKPPRPLINYRMFSGDRLDVENRSLKA